MTQNQRWSEGAERVSCVMQTLVCETGHWHYQRCAEMGHHLLVVTKHVSFPRSLHQVNSLVDWHTRLCRASSIPYLPYESLLRGLETPSGRNFLGIDSLH